MKSHRLSVCHRAALWSAMLILPILAAAPETHAEDVIRIDRERISQIAMDAVLLENPDLKPGDLEPDEGILLIICHPRMGSCFAKVSFVVISTVAKTKFQDEEGICWEKQTAEEIDVQVREDGTYTVRSGGGGGGKSTVDCSLVTPAS